MFHGGEKGVEGGGGWGQDRGGVVAFAEAEGGGGGGYLHALRVEGVLVDDATLCTSELVTNACVHAKGDGAVLWLAVEAGRVRVVVYDGDENPPVTKGLTPEGRERGGRGLYLVDALTGGRWGTAPAVPHSGPPHPAGKAVWFDLPVSAARRSAPQRLG